LNWNHDSSLSLFSSDSNGLTWASVSPTNALPTRRRWGRRFPRRNARPTSTETTPKSRDVCSNDRKRTTRLRTNRRIGSTSSAKKKLTTFCVARDQEWTSHPRPLKSTIRQARRTRKRKRKTRSDIQSTRRLLTPKIAKVRRAKRIWTNCREKVLLRKELEPEVQIGKISCKAFSDRKPDFPISKQNPSACFKAAKKLFCALCLF